MSEVANLYDNGPISPIAKIKENLTIWTVGQWQHYRIENIEPLPWSSPLVVEMILASGATFLAPYGTIGRRVVAILQPREMEFLHVRWEPIDDVEGILWEQTGTGKFVAQAVHARVTRETARRDPYLATTTFWILGRNREMNLEVRNPNPVIISQARFIFGGYRYMLKPLSVEDGKKIENSQLKSTWIPAEGF